MLRAVHSSPDAPAVDVYAEGIAIPLFTDLAYGDASLYASVPAGMYNIQLRAHPSTEADPVVYQTGMIEVAANQTITAIAAGFLASDDPEEQFRILPFVEDFGTPQSTLVRIVHASPNAPAVDLDLDGENFFSGLARFEDTGAEGVNVPSGEALQIGVSVADGDRLTVFTTPELPDGEEMFVIATGTNPVFSKAREEGAFSLLAVFADGTTAFIKQNPVIYAVHGSPDAPAVDIYAGESLLVENLPFGQLSGPIQVPPADFYALDFYATGSGPGSPVATVLTGQVVAGSDYIAVAGGELVPEADESEFALIFFEELFDETPPARTRVIHASGDTPPVDFSTVDGGTGQLDLPVVFQNLAFGSASDPSGLVNDGEAVTTGFALTGTTDPLATFDLTAAEEPVQTFIVVAGALFPDGEEKELRLIIVIIDPNVWAYGTEVLPNP
jgi:hypothetical protein